MYSFTPKPRRHIAATLICTCFTVGAVFTVIGAMVERITPQLVVAVDLLLIFAALVLSMRYMRTNYTYSLIKSESENASVDLVITEIGGKRKSTEGNIVCRISTRDIIGIYSYSKSKEKELKAAAKNGGITDKDEYSLFEAEKERIKKTLTGLKKYDYSPELFPTKYTILLLKEVSAPTDNTEELPALPKDGDKAVTQAIVFIPDTTLIDILSKLI